MKGALLVLMIILAFAINIFAVKFGLEEPRRYARVSAVMSGLLGMLFAICIPGAFLRFLLSEDSTHLMKVFLGGSLLFTAIAFICGIAIVARVRRSAA
ncbi:MAG: hypothetical protein EOO81_10090 [Oxalobacteraceae bacterium]|nr:MAG: hypothetical protein EOO81_10090 [Oxalobacteraceae bacterium]